MTEGHPSVGQAHLLRTFAQALDWYKSADSKAQVILTLDGAFVTFLSTTVFTERDDVQQVIGTFGTDTWILLGLMCLALAYSIVSGLLCLQSRIYSPGELDEDFRKVRTNPDVAATYAPEVMSFFQHVGRLKPEALAERMRSADIDFDIRALSHEVIALSTNVARKHVWVNRAFLGGALTVGLFLASAASYIFHL